ncbi:winged helix-turn-helix domain-containing protein [Gordonia bronchialis]|uniref:winged helix-turn-helix domain-containing protein n=1 Tax=Gordonia bronchialis TaxID=2054 RepID=UPI001CBC192B|nr:winged helix-turn-helix domain-containing protein [Gordonia bronchialis]UAK38351.1 winged helix-turn-helix domain-containing protein [Gordonia bronchialis]
MSLRSMLWAMEEAPVADPTSAMVVMALAERANPDGTAAYPTQREIAARARVSLATVKRRLLALEREGVIRRGNQALVDHIPQAVRPVVWDLVIEDVHPANESQPQLNSEPGLKLNPGSSSAAPQLTGELHNRPSSLQEENRPKGEAHASRPNGNESRPEWVATDNANTRVGKALNFVAVMGIAKWAIRARKEPPDRVADAIVTVYDLGKPITKTTVAQALDGKLYGQRRVPAEPKADPKTGYLVER